ncbi:MAG TPA: phosphoribosylamine--glycine ligase [Flavitalea sp.]|nr:phosphoribosylamine--glycine ligase [Flavitalea sp.]
MNPINILLLGSGGREHALAWKLAQSSNCTQLFIAPGNSGTAQCGQNVQLSIADFASIRSFCKKNSIGLVVVGPEEPLVNGITDNFAADPELKHIPVIGPTAKGAQLEGSKAFAKSFMKKYQIPTADYREFDSQNYEEGIPYLQNHPLPIVIKADGLAAGKGVMICHSHVEAMSEFELMIQQSKFGDAGKKVVVENFLHGIELSVFILTDGQHYVILPEAKDYKRIGEKEQGPNTGGMGAVSPVPFASADFMKKVEEKVIRPTVEGLKKEQINYKGFIFFGLIKVGEEPFLIEYNCRLGDPETEVLIPRIKNDLVEVFIATAECRLNKLEIHTDRRTACTVVAVSGGYPGSYQKGFEIQGLDEEKNIGTVIFHAGTRQEGGHVVTNGGRVLCVTAIGLNITEAVKHCLDQLQLISFEGMYYRKDIGYEFTE